MGKLFVGESITLSTKVAPKLSGVKLLPLPLVSLPSVAAVVEEVSLKSNLTPFVP